MTIGLSLRDARRRLLGRTQNYSYLFSVDLGCKVFDRRVHTQSAQSATGSWGRPVVESATHRYYFPRLTAVATILVDNGYVIAVQVYVSACLAGEIPHYMHLSITTPPVLVRFYRFDHLLFYFSHWSCSVVAYICKRVIGLFAALTV
jgi:hypothetical protein